MLLKEHLNGHLEGGLNKQSLTKLRRAKMKKMVNKEAMELGTQGFTAQNTKLFTYTGSKFRFKKKFDELHTTLGEKIKVKTYIEGFAGTLASLFHNLTHVEAQKYVINDFNKRIINLYKHIKASPDQLFRKLEALENEFQRIIPEEVRINRYASTEAKKGSFKNNHAFYQEAVTLLNTIPLDINHAALMLFVMQHNYRGLYQENSKGEYNSHFNWETKRTNTNKIKESLFNLHHFFNTHEVVFESMDVFELVQKYDERDTFIYLDPPYAKSKIQYHKGIRSFIYTDTHEELIEICNKQYNYVMYSNNFDETLCHHFEAHTSFERGKINGQSKLPTKEILGIKCNLGVYTPIVEILEIDTTSYAPINNTIDKSSLATQSHVA